MFLMGSGIENYIVLIIYVILNLIGEAGFLERIKHQKKQ